MRHCFIGVVMMGILFAHAGVRGQEPAPKGKPTAGAESKVLATVGKTEITDDTVNTILSRYPGVKPNQLASLRKRILGQLIQRELMMAYLRTAPCPADKLAETKKMMTERLKTRNMTLKQYLARQGKTEADLRASVTMQAIQEQTLSKEKVAALIKSAPPAYFDGTKLNASHILLMSPAYASQADKTKAREKLTEIAKEIKDGKVTFEAAAKMHSACPSSKDGGALGRAFPFEAMDTGFSKAAFALKVNEVSGIVESGFGYHLIKVTKRTEGTGKPGPEAPAAAKRILMTTMQADIIRTSAAANPVVTK